MQVIGAHTLASQKKKNGLTAMKVPGKKNNVTNVIIFIDTVSVFVLRAISLISLVIFSIFLVDFLDSEAISMLDFVS